jgi:hypothetical protein
MRDNLLFKFTSGAEDVAQWFSAPQYHKQNYFFCNICIIRNNLMTENFLSLFAFVRNDSYATLKFLVVNKSVCLSIILVSFIQNYSI